MKNKGTYAEGTFEFYCITQMIQDEYNTPIKLIMYIYINLKNMPKKLTIPKNISYELLNILYPATPYPKLFMGAIKFSN